MPTNCPEFRQPAFWRALAAEWEAQSKIADIYDRPEHLESGICCQTLHALRNRGYDHMHSAEIVYGTHGQSEFLTFTKPWRPPARHIDMYWFKVPDDLSRAALCNKIANDLEQQTNKP